ncbi:MAG: hypothetical protein N5P05_001316 [Chroococcopsis gigantea SAG 12.99]|jgi:CheY-like chemotaxis protein|nr:response regulator [Chlorogloea purpurea SAG 13.99]MDV2999710.1 hypothetical protein [Chroococcopsis gigantea SAG 12.99]
MAHFLIIDDEQFIREEWKSRLDRRQHSCEEAANVDEALEALEHSEKPNCEPFDMILLDHNLGDETGFDVLENLDKDYYQNRVIVITGQGTSYLAKQYATLGVIGHLIKPVSETQFECAIEAALQRRNIYVDQKENWESAYEVLEREGLVTPISELEADSAQIREQYAALKSIHEQLLADLKQAGDRESALSQAYQKAGEALNATAGGIKSILQFLNPFKITASFWSDVEYIFDSDRLQFFILQSYLQRIADNPLGFPVKHLAGGATGHYEYRIGRNYRLYFRREASTMILERYGNKNIQDKIIRFLDGTSESPMNL